MRWGILAIALVFQQLPPSPAVAGCVGSMVAPLTRAALSSFVPPVPTAYDASAVTTELKKLGFSCSPFNADTGLTCTAGRGAVPGYSEEMAIVIPPHYTPGPQPDLFLHINGNKPKNETFAQYLDKNNFPSMLARSGRNSILMLPYTHGATFDTNHADLGNPARFRLMMDTLTQAFLNAGLATASAMPSRIAISAHSGGSAPVGRLLAAPCAARQTCYKAAIKEVYLLDATYRHPLLTDFQKHFSAFAADAAMQGTSGPEVKRFLLVSATDDTVSGADDIRTATTNILSGMHEGFEKQSAPSGTGSSFVYATVPHALVVRRYLPGILSGLPVAKRWDAPSSVDQACCGADAAIECETRDSAPPAVTASLPETPPPTRPGDATQIK